jgi:tRNA1Val (adenine37-N6)-methyltransferase
VELSAQADETLDEVCGVRVLQRAAGYRVNLDPILLAHFACEGGLRGKVIDLGTGSGIIPLLLTRKFGKKGVTGLEVQPRLFHLAERNVALNRLEGRVTLVLGDLRAVEALFARGAFAHVLCNPPYRSEASGHLSPDPERAVARTELSCTLLDMARAAAYLLATQGTLRLVYPAARLGDLFGALAAHGFVPRRLRAVHPRAGANAKRVLLEAVRGGGASLTVEPPLRLHEADRFTDEVRQMLSAERRVH